MNRQAKRAMQRRQQAGERADVSRRQREMVERRKERERAGPRQFLKEVRQELKKVAWPGRREMFTYTLVVLVTVVVLTSFVFGLDFVIARGIFRVFGT